MSILFGKPDYGTYNPSGTDWIPGLNSHLPKHICMLTNSLCQTSINPMLNLISVHSEASRFFPVGAKVKPHDASVTSLTLEFRRATIGTPSHYFCSKICSVIEGLLRKFLKNVVVDKKLLS